MGPFEDIAEDVGDKLQLKHSSAVASPVLIAAMDPIEASKVYQRLMTQDDDS